MFCFCVVGVCCLILLYSFDGFMCLVCVVLVCCILLSAFVAFFDGVVVPCVRCCVCFLLLVFVVFFLYLFDGFTCFFLFLRVFFCVVDVCCVCGFVSVVV